MPAAAYAFWNGVFVPVKTPRDIVDRLYQETQKAIADPGVKERLAKLGIEPLVMSQPEFEKYFKADVLDTEKLAKAGGHRKAVSAATPRRHCGRIAMASQPAARTPAPSAPAPASICSISPASITSRAAPTIPASRAAWSKATA